MFTVLIAKTRCNVSTTCRVSFLQHSAIVDIFHVTFIETEDNQHNIIKEGDYASFQGRMTTLGFEQDTESNLYHHPCFQSKSKVLIEQIGKYSNPLPNAVDFQAELFRSRVAKEKQQHIHPVIADVVPQSTSNRAPYGSRKRNW